jgi:PEP-CTERM motif
MGRSTSICVWALAGALLLAPLAHASSWDEATNGDLSGDRLAPSALALTAGDNTVTGTTIAGDLDYLTVIVPTGSTLSQINLLSFVSADDLAFIGMQAGSTFTQSPTSPDVTQLLGWAHFGATPTPPAAYFDILGTSPGAIDFSGPLPAGPYTFWIQQANTQLVSYSWDFVVTGGSVPEPATAGLALLGLTALLGRVANRFLGRTE